MKKVLDWLGWISVFFTIVAVILTWLTEYSFTYRLQKYFGIYNKGYYVLQLCMLFTMLVWGIKFMKFRNNSKGLIYTILFILIAAGSLFFMYLGV